MASIKELLEQRESLDKKIQELQQAELKLAVTKVRQLIAEWQLSAEDCGFKSVAASSQKKARPAVAAKYRGPNGDTWSGRGRAPKWLAVLETQGRQRAEFLIS